MNYLAVLITFSLIMLVDKYRYRSPLSLSTRRVSHRLGTGEVQSNRSAVIEQENPGM